MARKRTGDPRDGVDHAGGKRFVPVSGIYGTEVVLPGPETAGPPKPEPAERWTLAPVSRGRPTSGDVAPSDEAPAEPVRGPERRPTGGSEKSGAG